MLSTICSVKQKSLQMCAELHHCQRWVTNRERQRVPQWRTRDGKPSFLNSFISRNKEITIYNYSSLGSLAQLPCCKLAVTGNLWVCKNGILHKNSFKKLDVHWPPTTCFLQAICRFWAFACTIVHKITYFFRKYWKLRTNYIDIDLPTYAICLQSLKFMIFVDPEKVYSQKATWPSCQSGSGKRLSTVNSVPQSDVPS